MLHLNIALGALAMLAPTTPAESRPLISLPVFVPTPVEKGKARLISGYISDADYPPEAYRARESGTTTVDFDVSPTGVVSDCRIKESSGSTILDARTCALIRERFRYAPAKDASGKAIAESKRQRVTWRLPRSAPPAFVAQMIPTDVDLEFVVRPDGSVESCRVLTLEGALAEKGSPCPAITAAGGFKPFAGSRNKRVRFRTLLEVSEQ